LKRWDAQGLRNPDTYITFIGVRKSARGQAQSKTWRNIVAVAAEVVRFICADLRLVSSAATTGDFGLGLSSGAFFGELPQMYGCDLV